MLQLADRHVVSKYVGLSKAKVPWHLWKQLALPDHCCWHICHEYIPEWVVRSTLADHRCLHTSATMPSTKIVYPTIQNCGPDMCSHLASLAVGPAFDQRRAHDMGQGAASASYPPA